MSDSQRVSTAVRTVDRLNTDLFERHDLSNLEEYLTPDCVQYDAGTEPITGPDAIRSYFEEAYEAYPDMTMTVENRVVDDDCVVDRFTMRGTRASDLTVGDKTVEMEGERFEWEGFVEFHLDGDKISEVHVVTDNTSMLRAAGIIPDDN